MIPLRSFKGFRKLTADEKQAICNGAGAKGSVLSKFIPNTLYGLDCREAFDRHDHGYFSGKTDADKRNIDLDMLCNMAILITEGSKWLVFPRLCRAVKYYTAVHWQGHDAFWADKPFHKRD